MIKSLRLFLVLAVIAVLITLSACASKNAISTKWSHNIDQRLPLDAGAVSLPAINNHGTIAIGGLDRRLYLLSANGNEIARTTLDAPIESGALWMNNNNNTQVIVGDIKGRLYAVAITAGNGHILWRIQLSSTVSGAPVALGDDILVQTTDNRLYRFNASGEKLWSFSGPMPGLGMRTSPSPQVQDDIVYAVFGNGDIVALNAISGNVQWKRQLLLDASAVVLKQLRVPVTSPVLSDELFFVPIYQGELMALSRLDGETSWVRQISLQASPIVKQDDAKLYAAASDGALYCLDLRSGQTLWKQQVSSASLSGLVSTANNGWWLTDVEGNVFRTTADGKILSSLSIEGRIARQATVISQENNNKDILIRTNHGYLYRVSFK
ncbi:MAG: PQQ-binding-like beta-propeller repeat protein [Mariprofundales bacterium]